MGSTYSNERNLSHSPFQQDETLERTMTCTLDCVHFAEVLAEAYVHDIRLRPARRSPVPAHASPPFPSDRSRSIIVVSSLDFPEVLLKIFAAPLQQTVMYKPSPRRGRAADLEWWLHYRHRPSQECCTAAPRFITIESREGGRPHLPSIPPSVSESVNTHG
jgi:hypothetical protein